MYGSRLTGAMKANRVENLAELVDLARYRTQRKRRDLLRNLTDIFMSSDGDLGDRELALMSDVMMTLLSEVEMAVRRELAERLSQTETAPHEVIVALANDEIEVAESVLLNSPVLHDPDLLEIVRLRAREHRLAIAGRESLSEAVGDALVDHGEEDVIERLLENPDAELSRRAMEYIVEESRRVGRFQRPLLRRSELPPELAHRMFWWVADAVRDAIVQKYMIDSDIIDDAYADISQAPEEAAGAPRDSAAERLADRLAEIGELDVKFLITAVRQGKTAAFIAGIARLAGVDQHTARRVVFDPSGQALAICWRAMGLKRADFASAFMLTRQPNIGNAGAVLLSRALKIYDSMADTSARRALNFWQRDRTYLRAVESGRD